ncbi:hypothetical protein AB6E88_00255 [Providencia hangzhouensis]
MKCHRAHFNETSVMNRTITIRWGEYKALQYNYQVPIKQSLIEKNKQLLLFQRVV